MQRIDAIHTVFYDTHRIVRVFLRECDIVQYIAAPRRAKLKWYSNSH